MKDYDFEGKVVLITGGTGSLGREVCLAFLKSNTVAAITHVTDKEIPQLESTLGDLMKKVILLKADIGDEQQVKNMVFDVMKKYGHIDILINVVGGYVGGKKVTEMTEKEWDLMMNLNLKTAFLISKHVVEQMVRQGSGKVVHVAARLGLKGIGGNSAYGASKSGLIRLVESLSDEVKDKNINVNCIMPSIIDTGANRKDMPNADFSKWVKPSEIARVMLFLASGDSRQIHGAAIPVYGLV
ncbi:MAG: SDR family oxidoreductase [Thaumarchaeota archaeon]|nr:SDR family oxidoreductase [Nitrososphaerota archaeon]MBI3642422.1 SDR family oxidoreductase [Nitrososphaerota archaeon]